MPENEIFVLYAKRTDKNLVMVLKNFRFYFFFRIITYIDFDIIHKDVWKFSAQ